MMSKLLSYKETYYKLFKDRKKKNYKFFFQSLEAISFAFARTNYQLQKISF